MDGFFMVLTETLWARLHGCGSADAAASILRSQACGLVLWSAFVRRRRPQRCKRSANSDEIFSESHSTLRGTLKMAVDGT